jgi:hypothetical protein
MAQLRFDFDTIEIPMVFRKYSNIAERARGSEQEQQSPIPARIFVGRLSALALSGQGWVPEIIHWRLMLNSFHENVVSRTGASPPKLARWSTTQLGIRSNTARSSRFGRIFYSVRPNVGTVVALEPVEALRHEDGKH